ncbi:MAG: hypothetical protein ACLFNY_00895 [Candidatus Aenigmatarchaeota archaeon]
MKGLHPKVRLALLAGVAVLIAVLWVLWYLGKFMGDFDGFCLLMIFTVFFIIVFFKAGKGAIPQADTDEPDRFGESF